jgi:tetratricopeptide (TPR) repeat protein
MSILIVCLAVVISAEGADGLKVGDYVFPRRTAKAYRMDGAEVHMEIVPRVAAIGAIRDKQVWLGFVWIDAQDVMSALVAQDFFARQAKDHADNPQWLVWQAMALRIVDKSDEAQTLLEIALQRDPKNWEAHLEYARLLYAQRKNDVATSHFNLAHELAPDPFEVYLARGINYAATDRFNAAIEDFDHAIKLRPDDPRGYLYRGTAQRDLKKYSNAKADFDHCLKINPYSITAFRHRGDTWYNLKEYDRAIADYTEAIRLEPTDNLSFMGRGLSFERTDSYTEAVRDFQESLRLDPKNYAVLMALAFLRATCKEPEFRNGEKAIAMAERACELTDRRPYALFVLAAAHAEAGNFDMAIKRVEEAIEKEPNELKKAKMSVVIIQYRAKMPLRDPR